MRSFVEPRVRRVVAEHLGVAEEDLSSDLSLVEDLAADSLDFAEVALALEEDLDLAIPEAMLDGVRTYGDLVETAIALARARLDAPSIRVPVVARVRRPTVASDTTLERAGMLTPYLAETLADDVLRGGPGASLEVVLSAPAEDAALQQIRAAFSWLVGRGVDVMVEREHQRSRRPGDGTSSAA